MSTDLSGLVLGPCMDAFAKSVTVTPIKSQPYAAPYPARGVWMVDNINIATEDGGQFSTRTIKLGMKLDEFAVPPQQYDMITSKVADIPMGYVRDALDPKSSIDFFIDNDQPDGQGGTVLILKRKT